MATGTATLNFGAFPGSSEASIAITGQTAIASDSEVDVWLFPAATADHSVDEHLAAPMRLSVVNVVPGTGFTIVAEATEVDRGPVEVRSLTRVPTKLGQQIDGDQVWVMNADPATAAANLLAGGTITADLDGAQFQDTNHAVGYDYGFEDAIPDGSTILGVGARLVRGWEGGTVGDSYVDDVSLSRGVPNQPGFAFMGNRGWKEQWAPQTGLGQGRATRFYGGPNDLWTPPSEWTTANIDELGLGVSANDDTGDFPTQVWLATLDVTVWFLPAGLRGLYGAWNVAWAWS